MLFDFEQDLVKVDNIYQRFEEIHNFIYANDGLSPNQTLEEILKILFIKFYDEIYKLGEFIIQIDEIICLKRENKCGSFSNRIINLFESTKNTFLDIFEPEEKIKLSYQSLGFIVEKLQNLSLNNSTSDAKGLAFQKFITAHDKSGRGQFFTPEPIIDFCVNFISPEESDLIIDPACGSGGFLFSSYKFIKNKLDPSKHLNISKNLFGFDINSNIAKIAKMKFILEGQNDVNIFCKNSLDEINELDYYVKNSKIIENAGESFDIVLTNPPFGTIGKITNTKILSQFELGKKWKYYKNSFIKTNENLNGQVTEILFIERCLNLLKKGGRMAIVLPNGHFENPSLEYLRYFIKQNSKILGIVNLPQETFIPFGTGVKTSILFLEKNIEKIDYDIFFSKIYKIGYQGNKNGTVIYKKDTNGNILRNSKGNQIIDEDFSYVLEEYKNYKSNLNKKHNNSFTLNSKYLNSRLDYDYYSPENRSLIESLSNYESVKISEIAEIIKQKSKKITTGGIIVNYVELSDINTDSFEIINYSELYSHELPSRASYELNTGDIITAVAGNSVGTKKHATAYVDDDYNGFICTNGFRVLRKFKINPYYLLYFFKTDLFLKQMYMYRTGAAIPAISDSDFQNIMIFLPPQNIIDEISEKVKQAIVYRLKSREILTDIINIELLNYSKKPPKTTTTH